MQASATQASSLVSPRIYGLILSSPRLKKKLLPGGLLTNPYKVLKNHNILTLEDTRGMRATFQRTQEVRFLQDGVAGFLDHLWGDGISLAYYENKAGSLEDSFKDEGRRHLVIGLKRPMAKGETLKFEVMRRAMAQFMGDEEWLETIFDRTVEHFTYDIVFPKGRPCRRAVLDYEGLKTPLSVSKAANGKTVVRFEVWRPNMDIPYTIRWSW